MTSGASNAASVVREKKTLYAYQEETTWLPSFLAALLLLCRYLTTTEGAVLGETLWIAQLSWLAGIVLAADLFRARSFHWTFSRLDAAVMGLGLAHAVSAVVNRSDLDSRAAVNMLCEWSGLVVTWFVVRRAGATASGRRQLVVL